jgi:hypothetical protein
MTQEVLKQMYQLLLTESHAPTVCAQLERIAREALAEHAMRETQRLGQEIEQEPTKYSFKAHWEKDGRIGVVGAVVRPDGGVHLLQDIIDPPQRKPLTDEELSDIWFKQSTDWMEFARAIEAAHGIKENT